MCHTASEFFPDKDRNDETSLEHYHQLSSRLRSRSPDSPRERLRQRVHQLEELLDAALDFQRMDELTAGLDFDR